MFRSNSAESEVTQFREQQEIDGYWGETSDALRRLIFWREQRMEIISGGWLAENLAPKLVHPYLRSV